MSTEGQKLDAELRRKAPQTEPYIVSSDDLNRWPGIASDLERLDGYTFTISTGRQKGRPMVFTITTTPVMPGKSQGDYRRISEDVLIEWKRSEAQKAGIPIEGVFIGPAYRTVDTTIHLEDGGTFSAKVDQQDPDRLALYTERRLPQFLDPAD